MGELVSRVVPAIRNGRTAPAAIQLHREGHRHHVCVVVEGVEYRADGADYWACLVDIRTELEEQGFLLCCAGARTDVAPSGMTRQAGGRLAYIHPPDRRPEDADLVDIFDAADPAMISTVDAQRASVESIREQVTLLLRNETREKDGPSRDSGGSA